MISESQYPTKDKAGMCMIGSISGYGVLVKNFTCKPRIRSVYACESKQIRALEVYFLGNRLVDVSHKIKKISHLIATCWLITYMRLL